MCRGEASHTLAGIVYPQGLRLEVEDLLYPALGTCTRARTHVHAPSGLPSRAAMVKLDLVSKALPLASATVKQSLRRTVPCFADSPPPSVMFRKPDPDHRGREQKAVLQTCLSLLAYIKSLGQSSGPEMKELNPESSKVPQMACSSASFLTSPPDPTQGPGLSITEERSCQAAGQGVRKVLSTLQSSPACNPFLKMSDVSLL